jgi:hypothetical protein
MQSPKTQETVWLVSFAEDDDREMTAEEIAKALASGEIVLTSIVWRDGMSDWKPIVEVPELRTIVQRQRVARQRSTVMGGFGTPAPPPAAPRPAHALTPRPPPAAAPPPPLPRAPEPRAELPRATPPNVSIGGSPKGSPRGSLAGGLVAPRRAATPSPIPPEPGIDELASSVLALADDDEPDTRQRHAAARRGDEGRTTLTGPGGPPVPPSPALKPAPLSAYANNAYADDDDAEPISLAPESLASESMESWGSDELESLPQADAPTAPVPPIFDIGASPRRPAQAARDADTTPPNRVRSRVAESALSGHEPAPPSVNIAPPERAPARTMSRGPAPTPPRPPPAAVPADPLADLDDAALKEPKKKGGLFGKVLIAALVLGLSAGAFALGRRTADPLTQPSAAPTTVAAPVETTVVSATPPVDSAPALGSVEPTASAQPEEPAEAVAEDEKAPSAAGPRGPAPRRERENVELSHEPAHSDLPAPTPKPEPASPSKPAEEPGEATEPFNKDAAGAALSSAAASAGSCRSSGDPSGVAQVSVTFSPSGRATRAIVDGPPFAGTATGGCIASRMTQAKVPPFTGSRVTVKKRVVIQ